MRVSEIRVKRIRVNQGLGLLSDSKSVKNLQCAPLRHSQTSVIKMPDVIIYQCDQTLASN